MVTDRFEFKDVSYDTDGAIKSVGTGHAVANMYSDARDEATPAISKFKFQVTKTQKTSFTHTAGVSVKIGMSWKAGIPLITEGTVTTEITSSLQFSYGSERTVQVSKDAEFNCVAPVGQRVKCSGMYSEHNVDIPYTMRWKHKYMPDCVCEEQGILKQVAAHDIWIKTERMD